MVEGLHLVLGSAGPPFGSRVAELCEHKGRGHPDSLCDGVAEAVSVALCAAYLDAYGDIRHHNVDKALLIGGQSVPRFGGGRIRTRMRLIVAGRADALPGEHAVSKLVIDAAHRYLASIPGIPPDLFDVESAVRAGTPGLRGVMNSGGVPLANDSSFGVGFAPCSALEKAVLGIASTLGGASFRSAFPAAGEDFKIMGRRLHAQLGFTIALALIDRKVRDVPDYFALKHAMAGCLASSLAAGSELAINTLDNPAARDESGLYLTVTGLSAEHGDDGQVGRGNRVNSLITPSRPMSLEAAAGKNPMSHTGEIYNVLAGLIARDLVDQVVEIAEASVQIVSAIGQPIDRPQLVALEVVAPAGPLPPAAQRTVRDIVRRCLADIRLLSRQLARGALPVF